MRMVMKNELEDKIFINSIIGTLVGLGIERLVELGINSDHNKIMMPSCSFPIDILTYHKQEHFISCSYKVGTGLGGLIDEDGGLFDEKDIETREIGISLDSYEVMAMLKEIIKK